MRIANFTWTILFAFALLPVLTHAEPPADVQTMVAATEDDLKGIKDCVPSAQAGYKHAKQKVSECVV
jgi:hypothetical protein